MTPLLWPWVHNFFQLTLFGSTEPHLTLLDYITHIPIHIFIRACKAKYETELYVLLKTFFLFLHFIFHSQF